MIESYAGRTHEKMKEVLMDPSASGPQIHYYMIRGGSNKRNITVWEPGTVGGEYIKAYGHYHIGDLEEDYTILEGEGIIILQSPIVDKSVDSFKAIFVKAGDTIHIPKNTGHLAINTGKTWLVTSDNSPVNFDDRDPVSLPGHADYESVRVMKGFAYYVVNVDGKASFVKNTTYINVPEVEVM
jgi:oxalate decarboxylase/phosphoglucose isomerase-like protein (cupin superfamily)